LTTEFILCFFTEFSSGAAAAAAAALGVRRFGGPIHPTGRLRYIPLSPLARYILNPKFLLNPPFFSISY
jgi:hypothetical protein